MMRRVVLSLLGLMCGMLCCLAPTQRIGGRAETTSKPVTQAGAGNVATQEEQSIEPTQQGFFNLSVVAAAAGGGLGVFLVNKLADAAVAISREKTSRREIEVGLEQDRLYHATLQAAIAALGARAAERS